jgi:hypothetical protein
VLMRGVPIRQSFEMGLARIASLDPRASGHAG